MKPLQIPIFLLTLLTVLASVGCAASNVVRIEANDQDYLLSPRITTAVYSYKDKNTVDIYLTDLDLAHLRPDALGRPPTSIGPGQLTHIAMFVRPYPGRTPIDRTAANTAIRHAVFTDTGVGVYAGGGFLLPNSSADSGRFDASVKGATLILRNQRGGFLDKLGPVRLDAAINAEHDEKTARLLRQTIDRQVRQP